MSECPVCKVEFKHILLERNLPASTCKKCEGVWISSSEYFSWLTPQEQGISTEQLTLAQGEIVVPLPVADTIRKALLCPDCGHILRRFKIWPDFDFQLDHCGGCNGIWFDRNEWQVLKLNNLHHAVHLFFTKAWQEKLRDEEMRRRLAKMYQKKFSQEDYEKIQEIRAWLAEHPHGRELLAYLTDIDPYQG
jgi:Zn-finger nucleic acid-binding protein